MKISSKYNTNLIGVISFCLFVFNLITFRKTKTRIVCLLTNFFCGNPIWIRVSNRNRIRNCIVSATRLITLERALNTSKTTHNKEFSLENMNFKTLYIL